MKYRERTERIFRSSEVLSVREKEQPWGGENPRPKRTEDPLQEKKTKRHPANETQHE